MKTIKFLVLTTIVVALTSCKKPEACMNVPDWVEAGQSFTAENCTVNAKEYTWDMGDGTIHNQKDPSHTYNYFGNFTVTLTASTGNRAESVSKVIQVVGAAHKFQGNFNASENCEFIGSDDYVMSITKINESKIQISNFLGGATIEANCTGNNLTLIPKYNIVDASGYLWDLESGTGYISGDMIYLEYYITDFWHDDIYGTIVCSSSCQRQ